MKRNSLKSYHIAVVITTVIILSFLYLLAAIPKWSNYGDVALLPPCHYSGNFNHRSIGMEQFALSSQKDGIIRNGSMTNVIFIHGLGQTPASWDKTVSFLSEHITADYVNLSSICTNGEVTYKNLYCAFEKYCAERTEPLNLCGISLGAILALNYAIDHAEKVRSLVLIAPQYKMPRLLLKLQNIIFFFMPKACFRKLGFTKKELIGLVNSMLSLDFRNDLSNISCPTLVICGEKDKANKKSAIGLANSISMSDLHLIENAGHEVNIDAPNKLAAILKSFYFSCPFPIGITKRSQ